MFPMLASWKAGPPLGTPPTQTSADQALGFHPLQYVRLFEELWAGTTRRPLGVTPWGEVPNPLLGNLSSGINPAPPPGAPNPPPPAPPHPPTYTWDHLIYAYMIEHTLIYEIFERVLCRSISSASDWR
jgi:hypothetical protein